MRPRRTADQVLTRPWANLGIGFGLLVGVPFAFTTGRRGSLYGLGVSVILAVKYLAAVALFTALGSAGYLNPLAAAWAPNALFAVAGLFFLLNVRT